MYDNELFHYGVKGMKWGHRKKYYNDDGSLNKLGQARRNYKTAKKEYHKSFDKAYNKSIAAYSPVKKHRQANETRWEDAANKAEASRNAKAEYKQAKKEYKESHPMSPRTKTALKIGAAAAGTALVVYGAYKAKNAIHYKAYSKSVDEGMAAVNRMEKDLRSARISMDMNAKRAGVDTLDLFDAFTKRDERVVNDARRAVYKNASNATRTLGDSIRILRKK